ncbi:MAG: M24 family metallopeptidase [Acidimicrobiales bacterium]
MGEWGQARARRMDRVRERLGGLGVDALLLSHGADLPWLAGYRAMPLERLTMLVVPAEGEATLVVPALEAPRVAHDPGLFGLRPWAESEDPVEIVAALVGSRSTLAVSDRAWAASVLALQARLPGARWRPASAVTSALRAVKDAAEVDLLRAAGAAADRVAAQLLGGEIALIGRTEAEVSADLGRRLVAEGHRAVNFAIVGSGPNSASPHHQPGERRIGVGEVVVCDFGGTLGPDDATGYCSDTTRTVVTGEPDQRFAALYGVLQDAQAAALDGAVVGRACSAVDALARDRIAGAGWGERFIHRLGHGIGIEEHEDPYLIEGNDAPLVAGHAFSVEPGIYLDGIYGARIEDIVVATDAGPEALNTSDHSLTVVEA